MVDNILWLKKRLFELYEHNPFIGLLKIKIDEVHEGNAVLSMQVPHELTNLFGAAHGGRSLRLRTLLWGYPAPP